MIIKTAEIKQAFTPQPQIEVKGEPTYNMIAPAINYPGLTSQPTDYKKLVGWVKKTPEAIGILSAILTDVVSDGYFFENTLDNRSRKSNKSKLAEKFVRDNFFKQELKAAILDWLMLGNGALWKATTKAQIKEKMSVIAASGKFPITDVEVKALVDEVSDESGGSIRVVRHVAWSTMAIDLTKDKKQIKQYKQVVSGDSPILFAPEEIIHAKFLNFDGKVYGFGPMEASYNVITTLGLIKDYAGTFFQNGGIPDWMFILPKEQAGSPNVNALIETLKTFKRPVRKHGNLVFTGEVEPHALNKFDKDMEFRQLAIYYTGVLALAFNMPMSRLASIIGSEVKSGATDSSLAEEGYWRRISEAQDYWETLLNSQIFIPEFGVEWKFNRSYKQDEVREVNAMVQKVDVVDRLKKLNVVNDDWAYRYLGVKEKDRSPGSIKVMEDQMGRQNLLDKTKLQDVGKQKVSDTKRAEAEKSPKYADAGMKEQKEMLKQVGVEEFDKIVTRWVKGSLTRKIHWYERDGVINMFVDLPDTSYVCKVLGSELSPVKRADWLGNSIKIESVTDERGQDVESLLEKQKRVTDNLKHKRDMLERDADYLNEVKKNLSKDIDFARRDLEDINAKKKRSTDKLASTPEKVEVMISEQIGEFKKLQGEWTEKLKLLVQDTDKAKADSAVAESERKKAEAKLDVVVKKVDAEKQKISELSKLKDKVKGEL